MAGDENERKKEADENRWIDPKAGIAGFFGTQMMGLGDQKISEKLYEKFERAIYTDYGK